MIQIHSLILCRSWETVLVILVIYTAWVSPFEFGFLPKPAMALSIADNVVNAFFAVDIVLTFSVAYRDRTTFLLVDDRKKIAWKYTTSWFVFDVISTIPSELTRKMFPSSFYLYGLSNMLRLWRLRRVSALFSRLLFFSLFLVSNSMRVESSSLHGSISSFETGLRRTGTLTTSGFDARSSFA